MFSECVYPCRVSMVYVCWLARKDIALDCSEDNVVNSDIPKLDSEHEEQDDSASGSSDVDDMALMHARLLPRNQWWALFQG